MENLSEYYKLIQSCSDDELEGILERIDREKHKDRYEIVLEELRKRKRGHDSQIDSKKGIAEKTLYPSQETKVISEIKGTFDKYGLLWKGFLSRGKYGGLGKRIISTIIDTFIIIFILSFSLYFIITKVLGYTSVYTLVVLASKRITITGSDRAN